MSKIQAYAAFEPGGKLQPFAYEPQPLGPLDVEIAITHCGVCGSDLRVIDNDANHFPRVAGHEIVGTITSLGDRIEGLSLDQRVGVGWQAGSCMACEWCLRGRENLCGHQIATCVDQQGGFAKVIRTDGRFVHPIPDALDSPLAAPLLCAGITVHSPLRRWAGPGSRVGIIGIGGLGHLAIQFARASGCEVTCFSTSDEKREDAKRFGAIRFVDSREEEQMRDALGSLDLILSTVTANLDWGAYLEALRPEGTLCFVGIVPGRVDIPPRMLYKQQKRVCGSFVGGRGAVRDMLAFAAGHEIEPQIELLPLEAVNDALERVRGNKARYRVVLEVT